MVTCVAADDPRVRGAALLSPRADFDDWAAQPRRFLEHAREIGAIRTPSFPPSFDEWARELRRFRPVDAARRLAPRPLLVMHGDDDDSVPTVDARQLAEAHGAAELRLDPGCRPPPAPRPAAVAVLLGWLDRQRQGESIVTVEVGAVPLPRRGDDVVEVVLRMPAEQPAAARVGSAYTATGSPARRGAACHGTDRPVSRSVALITSITLLPLPVPTLSAVEAAAAGEVVERVHVGIGEIVDVDVVAYARLVGCRVVDRRRLARAVACRAWPSSPVG